MFQPFRLGDIDMPHRIVMAPMTRRRALPGKIPGPLSAEYYAQRAAAALIISESTEVDPVSDGVPPTRPGIFNDEQEAGWRLVTEAVHAEGGRIFMQLSHMGRTAHPSQRISEALPLGPSPIAAKGTVFTARGPLPYVEPLEMTPADIAVAVEAYGEGARRAKAAGFDGVELHGANGYLIDQFLRDGSNQRADGYGGSADNRFRFLAEAIEATLAHWPANRIGMRFSPTNPFQDMSDSDPVRHFTRFAERLNDYRLAYLHVVENPMQNEGRPEVARHLRAAFDGAFIAAEGFSRDDAERWLIDGRADLVAFGQPFIANPDLVQRWRLDAPLNPPDKSTYYTPGPKGYTDYPSLIEAQLADMP
ncbi:MAG TPA: alkene reductase [Devosiaceae bacterium]|nr:alkene reductase [Devosiaceae bacterium]